MVIVHIICTLCNFMVYHSTISTGTKIFGIYSERMICFKIEVSSCLREKLNKTKNLIDAKNCNEESL